ncbi:NADPH-dependent FMN reductase [Streptomyces liangshanensis]|uniref:NADPH-dependent FMN reductase n=1 Tax=Streptomyces liangshanensis TaxID=2717324 RepID=UPI0036DF6653
MIKIGIILGSTRPARVGEIVADWVAEVASQRDDAEFVLVDVAKAGLPLFDEAMPPMVQQYTQQHTKDWSATIAGLDSFLFVTPEYNHSVPASLKNAIDFLHYEWHNKAAGFVSYGAAGGLRAVEHLRVVLAELKVATVRSQVALNSYTDFEEFYTFKPTERLVEQLNGTIDEVVQWGTALGSLRD